MRKRGELDHNPALMEYADKLEQASIDTVESGIMTGDLARITTLPDVKVESSEGFIKAIAARLTDLMENTK